MKPGDEANTLYMYLQCEWFCYWCVSPPTGPGIVLLGPGTLQPPAHEERGRSSCEHQENHQQVSYMSYRVLFVTFVRMAWR